MHVQNLAVASFILDYRNPTYTPFGHGNVFCCCFFCQYLPWLPPFKHNLTVKIWFNTKRTNSNAHGDYTCRRTHKYSKMRFGQCSGLITLPHLTCISEAWNLICMQLLFSITVWESWTQGLRSHYTGGRGVLEGGGRETEEGQRGRWCIMNWHFWGCGFSKSTKMSLINITEIPIDA